MRCIFLQFRGSLILFKLGGTHLWPTFFYTASKTKACNLINIIISEMSKKKCWPWLSQLSNSIASWVGFRFLIRLFFALSFSAMAAITSKPMESADIQLMRQINAFEKREERDRESEFFVSGTFISPFWSVNVPVRHHRIMEEGRGLQKKSAKLSGTSCAANLAPLGQSSSTGVVKHQLVGLIYFSTFPNKNLIVVVGLRLAEEKNGLASQPASLQKLVGFCHGSLSKWQYMMSPNTTTLFASLFFWGLRKSG